MPERRHESRPDSPDRRTFPRPPLWLNLTLLLLGVGGLVLADYHREQVSERFAGVIAEEARTPGDVKKLKEELAAMDLSREQLKRELEGRAKFAASLKSENFYLSIDTTARKLRFYYGDTVIREAEIVAGESRTVTTPEKTWTFIPLKGSFSVEAKIVGHPYEIPEWVYAMKNEPVPAERPVVPNGLGEYVIFLGDGYVLHTMPSPDSPLQGAKPGSYMIPEETMKAIWPRITKGTQVYIF